MTFYSKAIDTCKSVTRITCLPLKSTYAQDIVFEKDVSISYTEKDDLVDMYVYGVVDLRETEMMQIWLRTLHFHLQYRNMYKARCVLGFRSVIRLTTAINPYD